MPRTWTHVGRCWTNGEPFLVLDADLLPHWRGASDNAYEALVPDLAYDRTIPPSSPPRWPIPPTTTSGAIPSRCRAVAWR